MREVKTFWMSGIDRNKTLKAIEDEINDWVWRYAVKIVNTSISCPDSMSVIAIVTYEGEESE